MKKLLRSLVPAPIRDLRAAYLRRINARKTPREIFSEIYKKKSWGGESTDFFSGYGSHAEGTVNVYVGALAKFMASMPGARTIDLGCGDFNIGRRIRRLCGPYIACDVVPELIERNKRVFADADVDFRCIDIISEPIPPGDVALIRQVLQHLSNAQIASVLEKLRGYKYLIVTEHLPAGDFVPNIDKPAGAGIRFYGMPPSGVVLTAAPFNLPVISERVICDVPEGNAVVRTTALQLMAA
jgi:SAM-dependent methyltransferase